MKLCGKCKIIKNDLDFTKETLGKKGLSHWCKACKKDYRILNKEKLAKKYKAYSNKQGVSEAIRDKSRRHYLANRESILKRHKLYRDKNKESTNKRHAKRIEKDTLFSLKCGIRNLIRMSFTCKGLRKSSKTAQILGCSFEELHTHLRLSFELNYGIPFNHIDTSLLHIDHIIPLSTAKTEEEILKLNHYTNLQYLFKWDNLEKGNKLNWKII